MKRPSKPVKQPAPATDAAPFASKPPVWKGRQPDWPSLDEKPMVFIAQFAMKRTDVPSWTNADRDLFLFAGKVPFHHPKVTEPSFSTQFKLVETWNSAVSVHHLFQDRDVVYQSAEENWIYNLQREGRRAQVPIEEIEFGSEIVGLLDARLKASNTPQQFDAALYAAYQSEGSPKPLKKWLEDKLVPQFRWLTRKPRWTEDEGEWPFVGSTPALFIAQTHVPETPVTTRLLSDAMVYLFAGKQEKGIEYKIIRQECGQQTAEAHYRAEELMAAYQQNASDQNAVEKIIKQGDKWVHAFIVGQPNLSAKTLSLLAASGKSKEVKDQAKSRLKTTG